MRARAVTVVVAAAGAIAMTPLAVGAGSGPPDGTAKTSVPNTAAGGGVPPTGVPVPPTVPLTTAVALPTFPTVPTPTTLTGVTTLPTPATAPVSTVAGGPTVLTDNTDRITVSVPAEWVDTDPRPGVRDDGGRRPVISASPDLDQWTRSWAIPGTYVTALPPTIEPATLVNAYTWNNECTAGPVLPYSDGRLTGQTQVWSACGGGTASITVMSGRPADNSYTVYAQVQTPAPTDPAVQLVLGSVGAVPGANPGEVSPPAAVPATATPVAATLLQGPIAPGSTPVSDETGRLSVSVPAGWTDVNGSSWANDDFSERPRLVVAPVIDSYFNDWAAPGLELWAFPFRPDPFTILVNRGWSDDCDDGGVQTLSVRGYTGVMQTWTNCGGTPTRIVAVAATPANQSATLYFETQLPTADDTALITALASFSLDGA